MAQNLHIIEKLNTFALLITIYNTIMARPIRETPILTGEDAIRFEERRLEIENMSEEQRAKNREEFEKRVSEAKKLIQFCL